MSFRRILDALDERTITDQVGLRHDEARLQFHLPRNTVDSYPEFARLIADYLAHHFAACITPGGRLSRSEAEQRAKEILEKAYQRQDGDIVTAFDDARTGTNGGCRVILDTLAEALKEEAIERYVSAVFDRFVMPCSWPDQVEIIRQFIAQSGPFLSATIDPSTPERYAHDFKVLIHAFAKGLVAVHRIARRL